MVFADLHAFAKCAVDRMRRMADIAGGDLTDFHERQLVHALFTVLHETQPALWAAFEYRYFDANAWLCGRADICAWVQPCRAWLEVKSTGLNPAGWDNSHRGIWLYDVTKLEQVRDEVSTQVGWVWLFLFETYRTHTASLGSGCAWTGPYTLGGLAPTFGSVETESGRLARSLHELDLFVAERNAAAWASVIPQLPRAEYNVWQERTEYSALLVTVDLSRTNAVA